jgi:hypothetical protein
VGVLRGLLGTCFGTVVEVLEGLLAGGEAQGGMVVAGGNRVSIEEGGGRR